jgi:hypothetical protein
VPGNGSLDEQEVALAVDADHLEMARGATHVAVLNVRAASTDPIDPGWRVFMEPWLTGPRLKPWRLTVPANPLP